jgi:8-oxo-dGTP diphosphatase
MARQLAWAYADREITKIVSSPFPRCVETVVPLAASLGLAVEQHWELGPDSELEDILTLLVDLPDSTLACTHREVIEKVLGGDTPCEKGAAWILERSGPELVPALYIEAPAPFRAGMRQPV